MTREQVLKLFPDATDEQVTNLLNQTNAEVVKEKTKAEQYKVKADKTDELQKKLDDLESGSLTEIEQANKNLEKANARIAELEKAQTLANQRTTVAEKFKVTAEQAAQIVKDDGTFDYDVLGQIITEKETAAAQAKEQEIANNSTNPGGGAAGNKNEQKTFAEEMASKIGKTLNKSNETSKSILGQYIQGGIGNEL